MSTIEKLIKKVDEQKRDKPPINTSGISDHGLEGGNRYEGKLEQPESTRAAAKEENEGLSHKTVVVSGGSDKIIRKQKSIILDYDHLGEAGIFTPDRSTDLFRREFRRIKRPILSNAFGKSASLVDRGNLIMVTSSVPGEGKTFTAINLALSIASERDYTVLLVDADVAKSDLTKLFGLTGEPGLSDLLLDENLHVSDVLIKTDIANFNLIPSGAYYSQMTELIASNRMTRVINELGERYGKRAVIFDTPPILATSEAQLLAELSGQIAYVVQAGRTPQYVVQEAIATLDQDRAIGLILNRTQNLLGAGYQSGYYGQYADYGNYGS